MNRRRGAKGMGRLSSFALSAVLLLRASTANAQPVCTFATLFKSANGIPVSSITGPMIAGANGQVVGSGTLYATDGSITFELTTTAGVWDDRVTWYIYDSADSFRQDYLQNPDQPTSACKRNTAFQTSTGIKYRQIALPGQLPTISFSTPLSTLGTLPGCDGSSKEFFVVIHVTLETEPVYLSWLYVSNNTQDGDYNDYNPPCTSTDSWFGFGIFYLSCGACGFGGPAPILSPTPSPSPDPIAVPTYPASPSPDPIAVPTYAASPIPAPVYPTHAPCGPGTYSPCPGSPTLSPKPSPGPEPTAVVDYTPAPAPVYPTPTPTSTPSPSRNPFVRGFPYSDCTNRNVTLSQYRVRNPFGPIDVPAGDFDAPAVRYCMDIVSVGTCDDRSRCCGMQLYKLQLLIRDHCAQLSPKPIMYATVNGVAVNPYYRRNPTGLKTATLGIARLDARFPTMPALGLRLCLTFNVTATRCNSPLKMCTGRNVEDATCQYAGFNRDQDCCPTAMTDRWVGTA